MGAIFGYINFNDDGQQELLGQKMQYRMNHWGADEVFLWNDDHAYLGQLQLSNSSWNGQHHPIIHQPSGHAIVADATLYNRDELFQLLGLNFDPAISDATLILKSYLKWGVDCPKYLNGDFAFAIWNPNDRVCYCARDHHGVKPFYYFWTNDILVFATEIKGILELPFVKQTIDEVWVADYLCRIWLERDRTMYQHIKRLEPSTYLCHGSSQRIDTYWHPLEIIPQEVKSDEDYIAGFKEKLNRAVGRRTQTNYKVGAELSGGLDSSVVTLLAKQFVNEVVPFSYVLPAESKYHGRIDDERYWIEKFAQAKGIDNVEFIDDENKGLLDALTWNEAIHDEPPKEMNSMFRDTLYQKASNENIRVLLSGYGGDDMVSHHASGYVDEWFRSGNLAMWWKEARALSRISNKSLLKKIWGTLVKASMGFDHMRLYKLSLLLPATQRPLIEKLQHRPIRKELFDRVKMQDRFQAYQERYLRTGKFNLDQVRRLQQPHGMYRLEVSDIATRSYKMEYRYPLLDVDLISYYYSLPLQMKARNGRGRYIFRQAAKDLIPEDLLYRKTKSGTSNPQVNVRNDIDGGEMFDKLKGIDHNHPVHAYADFSRLYAKPNDNLLKGGKVWHQHTMVAMGLLLAKKIEATS